ncbi:hypothetical protein IPL68_06345 [Candidatus Saccharibacteria bacterium]|nr:MAG: hypothetical protein IPL68_06345 [Candidatus Saccharibacteria bacterium]
MSDNSLKEWVIQLRYPYTAGVIAVIWLGSATLAIIRPEVSGEALISLVAFATLIVAYIGFSSGRR